MGESNGIRNDADDYAKALGTINYEVLCMVSRRVPRVYIENGKIVEVKNHV
jgi:alanine racemase